MKVLVVEDNKLLATSLRAYLQDAFMIDAVHTAAEGLEAIEDKTYDVLVLDLMLPDGNGYDICRKLRKTGADVPVLILTAETDTKTKVRLLDAGADDFLTKPFQPEELRARLHALLRRHSSRAPTSRITIKGLTIDLA